MSLGLTQRTLDCIRRCLRRLGSLYAAKNSVTGEVLHYSLSPLRKE